MKGGPYRDWYQGGDGMDNGPSTSYGKAHGESCSGVFVRAFRSMGKQPAFTGTYSALDKVQKNGGVKLDPGKTYPIGTFIVSSSGDQGHMVMVSGPDNTLFQSDRSGGINEGKKLGEMNLASYDLSNAVAGTIPEVGSSSSPLEDLTGGVGSGMFAGIGEEIATGVARALIRFIRAIYCLAILWPIDWLSGFWWEATLLLGGGYAKWTEDVDILGLLKGEDGVEVPSMPAATNSDVFAEENVNRFYWLVFFILTYVLAFGTDRKGQTHFDNIWDSGEKSSLGPGSSKGYHETATLEAAISRRGTGSVRTGAITGEVNGKAGGKKTTATLDKNGGKNGADGSTEDGSRRDTTTGRYLGRNRGSTVRIHDQREDT